MTLTIRPYEPADQEAVVALWKDCQLVVPSNDPVEDIEIKRGFQPGLFLVALWRERLVGTVMAGFDGHRGWINYLAVDPARRRADTGTRLMQTAEEKLRRLGCPKINLQVRRTNTAVLAFYHTLGYSEDDVVSLGKRLT
jgi:ribosomal protein S18 acetylase RimI-like enzyme